MTESVLDISIIIPVYNQTAELDRCLDSLNQSELKSDFEIIIVDDCSPEEGASIEKLAGEYNARFYRQAQNAGPGVARNRGAHEARGQILVFIDSDCVAPAGWLSKLIQPIRDGKSFAATGCYCGPVTQGWITTFQDEDYRYRMPSEERETSFVNSCNFAIDRGVFQTCGGFPEQRISEDMVFGMLLSERGTPARYIPSAGVKHNYYRTLYSYLKQRYSFAFNTVRSFLDRNKLRSKEAKSNEQSFNPLRTALGMFFISVALFSFIGAVISGIFHFSYTRAFILVGLFSLLLETVVHGRFLLFLLKRQGLKRSLSYIFLLYLIDLVYVYAVLKALTKIRSW